MTKGKKIRLLRESLNMTQTELAKKTNSSKQTIYKYENDIVTNIPSDKISLLALALETTPSYLIGWNNEASFPYLTERRKELGLTMRQVADAIGVSEATVRRWESGAIANMRRDRIFEYAKILQVKPTFIMAGELEESETAIPEKSSSLSLSQQIEKEYDKNAAAAFSLFLQLDHEDQIRVNERIKMLLEDEKYTSGNKKGLLNNA